MNFNKHSELLGLHAFLGASKYHWINYDDERLKIAFSKHLATQKGTELHDFACRCIQLGIRLERKRNTLNLYVNDCIGFKMTPEQPLYYSENCFGTTDAISFRKNVLRIFDYKSGTTPASFTQLEIYAALFCLEYKVDPNTIEIELRLYQNNECLIHNPEKEKILYIMNKIIVFDKQIEKIKSEG